ncbi:MAG: hypothetical protein Fur0035_24730 [Anaerolineales bacterium]
MTLKRLRALPLFEIALASLVMGVHLYAALAGSHFLPMRWFLRDDAYYYFKVAQNISQGLGSTFDGINPTNGYHPLWLLICVPIFALARFDLILPLRIVLLLQAALSAASSLLLYRLLKRALTPAIAVLAASFWALDLTLHNTITQMGLETGLLAFSLLLLLTALQRYQAAPSQKRLLWLSAAATLTLFSRLDSIYLVLLLGVWLIFRRGAFAKLLLADLFISLSAFVLAVLQRTSLQNYLPVFSSATLLAAALRFAIQSLLFYFFGLYQHPKAQNLATLILKTTLGSLIAHASILALTLFFGLGIPRSAALLALSISLPLSLGLRLGLRFFSPWPPASREEQKSPLEELRSAWRAWLADALTYFGPLGAALGVYLLYNRLTFGTSMPVSGQIKRWWGLLRHDIYGGEAQTPLDIFGLDPHFSAAWNPWLKALFNLSESLAARLNSPTNATFLWALIFAALLALALIFVRRKQNLPTLARLGLFPLLLAAELHVFFYGALPYGGKQEWYWVTEILAGLMLLAALADFAIKSLPFQPIARALSWGVSLALSLSLAWNFSAVIVQRMPPSDAAYAGQPYLDMTTLLEENTESGALIGMTGGGNVGYFIKDRTIVNLDGLINSYAYFQASQNGQGDEFLAAMGLDYVFANPDILTATEPYAQQFKGRLEHLPGAPAYGGKLILRFLK